MRYSIVLVALLMSMVGWAQKPLYTQAQLESARVYYNGAELTQKAQLKLPKGMSEVVITNVSDQLNENTIQVGSIADVTVMSVQFSNSYIEEYDNAQNSPLAKPLRDSIAMVELALDKMTNEINADLQTVQLLDNRSSSNGDKEYSFADMTKWVDYYKSKRQDLQNGIYLKKKEKEKIEFKWNDLKSKLALGASSTGKTSQGKLIVQVMNAKEGEVPFRVNYLTNRAQWVPSYDLRIDKVGAPIKMMYKAQVVQTSGIDWRNVKLSLTSGMVNQNTSIPRWSNWFIGYEPIVENEIVVSTGYQNSPSRKHAGAVSRISSNDMMVNAAPTVAEQVSYSERQTMAEYTNVVESQLNVTFDISIPYSIVSNGKKHSVDLNTFEMKGDYQYYSVPKLDATAYLVAKVADYSKHNLLPGDANVIFDGMNVGKTFLNTENTDETLRLNLGKDPKVSLERILVSDKSGTKTLSSKKEQSFTYEITVKNNKNEAVDIQVEDQFPLSTDTSIEVTLNETSGAEVDNEKGLLKWNINMKPNESKKIRFSYQIRYNKDRTMMGI
ncbi:DUF4139 domain-containing protein [Myroides guanonis]|uniref:DUF4139 domain-containing protein n=1 Tax=Myroides guanonis TaxID=1150112 RepID=A0A1I3TPL1_9FLAO|nr:DUF4139 domain-containing protein [Myroides guanonis]SFJ71576.1 conserved hypothetical protein [Myroides guanonis]